MHFTHLNLLKVNCYLLNYNLVSVTTDKVGSDNINYLETVHSLQIFV